MATPFTQQVRPITKPSSIAGLANGQFPADKLHPIYEHGDPTRTVTGRLCPEAARAWNAMAAHAWRDGLDLRPVSPNDSYRPLEVQQGLFARRYTTTDQGNGSRVCSGRRWWKRRNVATAACPGTSNHGWALAVDQHSVTDELAWLEEHAWTYGFAWELVPEEPWHIRYCTGDAIPAAVLVDEEDDMPTADEVATAVVNRLNIGGTANGLLSFQQTVVEGVNLGRASVNALARIERALGDMHVDAVDEAAVAAAVLAGLSADVIAAAVPDAVATAVVEKLRDRLEA